MTDNTKYIRKFIILEDKLISSLRTKYGRPKGHAKIEVRDGKGKLNLNVEGFKDNIEDDTVYKGVLISKAKGELTSIDLGTLVVKANGKASIEWKFDPEAVGNSKLGITDFNIVAVKESKNAESKQRILLAGYIHNDDSSISKTIQELEEDNNRAEIHKENIISQTKIEEEVIIEEEYKSNDEHFESESIEPMEDSDANDIEVMELDTDDEFIESIPETEEVEPIEETSEVEVEEIIEDNKTIKVEPLEYNDEVESLESAAEDSNTGDNEIIENNIAVQGYNDAELEEKHTEYQNIYEEENSENNEQEYEEKKLEAEPDEKELGNLDDDKISNMSGKEMPSLNVEKELEDYFIRKEDIDNAKSQGYGDLKYDNGNRDESLYGHPINPDYNYTQKAKSYSDQIASYTMNMLKYFNEVEPFKEKLWNYTWWEIEYDNKNNHRGFLPFFNYISNMYYPYPFVSKVTTCQNLMKKYDHYIFGVLKEEDEIQYYVYGVPGKFTREEQPFNGATGFVNWLERKGRSRERLGYWLLYIDAVTGKIVTPLNPTKPKR